MICANCQREIAENSRFCYHCGTPQAASAAAASYVDPGVRRLRRSSTDKVFGGVCGGFAEYFDMDPVLVRVIWAIVAITTGVGLILYLICWIVMDQAPEGVTSRTSAPLVASAAPTRRLRRSAVNAKWAGVCGGIAEHLGMDPTVVRLVWVILSVVPGAIIGGLIVYLLAWLVMPPPETNAVQPVHS